MQEYKGRRLRVRVAAVVVAVTALAGLYGGAVAAAPQCPVVRYNAQATGWTNVYATYNPTRVWTLNIDYATTPVIGQDGSLYLGNGSRSFASYSSGGALQWTYNTPASVAGSAALGADGSIYVGLTGQLLALLSSGTSKWASPYVFTCGATPAPVIVDRGGTLYFGADDKKVYAVNPDGTTKWTYSTGGIVKYSCAVSRDGATVYVTSGDGSIYAINASNGLLRWKSSSIAAVYNCAVADDGTIYVGSTNGKLYAFAPDGTQKWTYQSQSKVTCAPAIAPDGTVYFGSQDTYLYALDAGGHLKWRYRTYGPVYSAPTIDEGGNIILTAWPGVLTELDPLGGTVLWSRTLTASSYSPAIIDQDGSIYALSTDGVLAKFSGPHYTPEPSSLAALGSLLVVFGSVLRAKRRR